MTTCLVEIMSPLMQRNGIPNISLLQIFTPEARIIEISRLPSALQLANVIAIYDTTTRYDTKRCSVTHQAHDNPTTK